VNAAAVAASGAATLRGARGWDVASDVGATGEGAGAVVCVGVGEGDGEGAGEGVGVGVGETAGSGVGVGDGETAGSGVGDGVGVAVAEATCDTAADAATPLPVVIIPEATRSSATAVRNACRLRAR